MLSPLRLPKAALSILYEASRHLLRRPVVGIAALPRTADGRYVLIRRADTGEWALPGGTLEWGETLLVGLGRELAEEAGILAIRDVRLVGVFSRPDRDPRFHAVTVVVACDADTPTRPPSNPLEILEVQAFAKDALPRPLAMGMTEMLDRAIAGGPPHVE